MYKGLVRQHEGSKFTDRTTRTRSVLFCGQCLLRSRHRKQSVRRVVPDAQGFRGKVSAGGKGVSSIRQETESEVGGVFLGKGEGVESE